MASEVQAPARRGIAVSSKRGLAPVSWVRRSRARADHRRRLRVGLFVDSPLQPRWLVEAFRKVAALDVAMVVAVVEGASPPAASTPWPWRAYARIDARLFSSPPDPLQPVDLRRRFPCVPSFVLPDRDAGSDYLAQWRAKIKALHLDVVLAAGGVDDDMIADLARYGAWRYCHGETGDPLDEHAFSGHAGAARVVMSGLRAHRGGHAEDRLVYRSWSRTFPFSVARGRDHCLRKAEEFAARALRELHRSEHEWLARWSSLPRARAAQARRAPAQTRGVRPLLKLASGIARRGVEKLLYQDQWMLAYRFGREEAWSADLRHYSCLVPPKDRFWADPFPIERDGRHYIFFEELVFAAGRAHISVIEVGRDGRCTSPVRVLERDYHLSYPQLIEWDGELFMIPETGENRTVEIYRCTGFPHRWTLEKVLLKGAQFADATVHRGEDRWWMFVNIGVDGGEAHDELHLYYADALLGEWMPHPANPVKSDVRCARPAGRLYERGGVLYRPAQICSPLYGSGVSVNRVLCLTPDAFREEEEERILPERADGVLGIHTLNRAGELIVIDAFIQRARLGRGTLPAIDPRAMQVGRVEPA